MISYNDTFRQRKRLGYASIGLVVFGVLLVGRLFYLQVVRHSHYSAQALRGQTSVNTIPARRGELYLRDGETGRAPLALNQTLKVLYADPRLIKDKAAIARQLAGVTGGDATDYQRRMERGSAYALLAERVPNDIADKVRALNLYGIGLADRDYRTYPEGSLAAQVVGFVNTEDKGQYGIEQYLDDQLNGVPGRLAGKVDTHGIPIATADNVSQPAADGKSYLLTIDRNIQAMAEAEIERGVKDVKAKSGSIIVLDPKSGAIRAMANYPTFDPNQYSKTTDYSVFLNQVVTTQFEPGSGMKAFTIGAGLDQGKITPDSKYDDPGCNKVGDRTICNAAGDRAGAGKTMTMVLRDSLNTGVMHILRLLGGDPAKITLAGKKVLYDYFTKHFGFGQRTGVEQANEVSGAINTPGSVGGNDVNYANMSFGQGMSVTMVQMTAAMAAVANGGKLYQPHLVEAEIDAAGKARPVTPKLLRDHVISPRAAADLTKMLTVVVEHGSGYRAKIPGYTDQIAGKTGTAQIPRPDGKGYIEGANIGTFTGFAPASDPKFVLMVRINEPHIQGYAEVTTVPVFRDVTDWLFKYYGVPPAQ